MFLRILRSHVRNKKPGASAENHGCKASVINLAVIVRVRANPTSVMMFLRILRSHVRNKKPGASAENHGCKASAANPAVIVRVSRRLELKKVCTDQGD